MTDIPSTERIIMEMQKERCKISSAQSSASGCIESDHLTPFGATNNMPDFG